MSTKKTQLTRIELKFFIQKGMEIKIKDEHDDKKQRCKTKGKPVYGNICQQRKPNLTRIEIKFSFNKEWKSR
jgi:hypothetical protein